MNKIVLTAMTVAFAAAGVAAPLAANAVTHPTARHHAHHAIKQAPCTGLGIDLALGSTNICIPL